MDSNIVVLFWQWFKSVSNDLYSNINNADTLGELDSRIRELGPFDWEVGPLNETIMYLAISPCLNDELLKATHAIVSLAPSCEGWTFFAAKPKKEYSPRFNMLNESRRTIEVDISTWSYVLYYFEDKTFDIDIRYGLIEGGNETEMLALEIALTNLIGEERYMTLFKNVKIVREFGQDGSKATLIKYLDKHLNKILDQRG